MKRFSTRIELSGRYKVFCGLAAFVFWCSIWWLLSGIVDKAVLLPSPPAVFRVFLVLVVQAEFWISIAASLVRVLLGYFLGCLLGVLLASLCSYSRIADVLISPFMSVVRAVPVASFIILALVWLERSLVPAFIAFLMVLPIISGNVRAGIANVDTELLEAASIFRFTKRKILRYLYFPAVLPYFLSGAQTSLGLAWKAGVAAEVLCSLSPSIGGNIYESKLYLETEALFAWTITVILISICIEKTLFRLPVLKPSPSKTEETL